MAVVLLPSLLAAEAGGQRRFEVDAATVREALRALPVANLIFDERGQGRPLVNVFVDGRDERNWDTPLHADAEVRVVAAIAGGDHAGPPHERTQSPALVLATSRRSGCS